VEACWRLILALHCPERFSSVDQGIYGHLTLPNLTAMAAERGVQAEQIALWQRVLQECPGEAEATARPGGFNRPAQSG
jgi:hypothetical protein